MPDWLAQTTGMTQGSALVLTVILALLFVIVLAVVLIPQLKRFARTSYKGSRSRQPRLAIMDATDLDARRRLLLVRRDNVEHLIMIGGANDVVVEQGIIVVYLSLPLFVGRWEPANRPPPSPSSKRQSEQNLLHACTGAMKPQLHLRS